MVINVEENFSSTGYPGILLCISASTTAQYTGSPLKKVTVYYGISPLPSNNPNSLAYLLLLNDCE